MRILKVGEVDVGSKPPSPRGEVGSLETLPDCLLLCWAGVYGEEGSIRTHLLGMWFSFGRAKRSLRFQTINTGL